MLKLNYTEDGLFMEQIMTTVELWIAQRVILALRLGRSLYIESGRASFLLPVDLPELRRLELLLQGESSETIAILPVDDQWVEVSVCGSWVAECQAADEGLFLIRLNESISGAYRDRIESFLYELWQMSQTRISSLA